MNFLLRPRPLRTQISSFLAVEQGRRVKAAQNIHFIFYRLDQVKAFHFFSLCCCVEVLPGLVELVPAVGHTSTPQNNREEKAAR